MISRFLLHLSWLQTSSIRCGQRHILLVWSWIDNAEWWMARDALNASWMCHNYHRLLCQHHLCPPWYPRRILVKIHQVATHHHHHHHCHLPLHTSHQYCHCISSIDKRELILLLAGPARADTTTACSAIAVCLHHVPSFCRSYAGQRYYSFIPWPQCQMLGDGMVLLTSFFIPVDIYSVTVLIFFHKINSPSKSFHCFPTSIFIF